MPDFRFVVGLPQSSGYAGSPICFSGPNKTFNLGTERLCARLQSDIPDRLLDLLEIACAVFAADRRTSRGDRAGKHWGSAWRRNFRFTVAVRDLPFWQRPEIAKALSAAIEFLTEDSTRFSFVENSDPVSARTYFDFDPNVDGAFRAEDVLLFSGGLDSLAGAVETLATTDRNVVLVTHLSAQKLHTHQKGLADSLSQRFPGRVFWLPVQATLSGDEGRETTQRSRTLLFATLGFMAAKMFGADHLRFFENGVVSLNLPISEQIVGTLATRTTHPRSLALIGDLLKLVSDAPFAVENPYIWRTKTEVVETLLRHGERDLIRLSFSCSHVRDATTLESHCGKCSQCIDRRFATLAAGAEADDPAEMYAIDLLIGARRSERERTMPVDYVRRAQAAVPDSDREFFSRFGSEIGRVLDCFPGTAPNAIAAHVLELHRRHRASVQTVIAAGLRRYADGLSNETVPSTALLRLMVGSETPAVAAGRSRRFPDPDEEDAADGGSARWTAGRPLEIAIDRQQAAVQVRGLTTFDGPKRLLILALKRYYDEDLEAGLRVANHRWISASKLADDLAWDEPNVRKVVQRCRRDLADFYAAIEGVRPDRPLLIETHTRNGYRLDPTVRIISPAEAAATA